MSLFYEQMFLIFALSFDILSGSAFLTSKDNALLSKSVNTSSESSIPTKLPKNHMDNYSSTQGPKPAHLIVGKKGVDISTFEPNTFQPSNVKAVKEPNNTVHTEIKNSLNHINTTIVTSGNETESHLKKVAVEGGGEISVPHKENESHLPTNLTITKGRIIPRKGVSSPELKNVSVNSLNNHSSTSPHSLSNSSSTIAVTSSDNTSTSIKKPKFTMVDNDKDNSESSPSFIESSTTGKDYVFPIVLAILVFPIISIIIRIIYKRGTEFTERQQYHRMYLIDGMYNSR